MEQIKLNKKDLNNDERKNVFLVIACGCFNTIHNSIPGPPHKKQKRVLRTLAEELLQYVSPRIPKVESYNLSLFEDTIKASGTVLNKILDESGSSGLHIMLNLAGFCMEKLPVSKSNIAKYNSLFDMWEEAQQYEDCKSGDHIFARIETEVNILVAQRGSTIY